MPLSALHALEAAASNPLSAIDEAVSSGQPVVRTLGVDAPRELIMAAGAVPVRLVAPARLATPNADKILGDASLGTRGKRLLEQLVSSEQHPVLITHADAAQPQIFAALRELGRQGERVPERVHFLDLLHLQRESSRRYNEKRLKQLIGWLAEITGTHPTDEHVATAVQQSSVQAQLLKQIGELRWGARPRISGTQSIAILAATAVLKPERHIALLRRVLRGADELPEIGGRRVYVSGSPHEHTGIYRLIESAGAIIVGEDHEWGEPFISEAPNQAKPWLAALAEPALRSVGRTTSPADRARRVAEEVLARGAEMVIHVTIDDDEAAPWDVAAIKRALVGSVPFLAIRSGSDGDEEICAKVQRFLTGQSDERASESQRPAKPAAAPKKPASGARSRKSLQSLAGFSSYQREWFASVRAQTEGGTPFAVVNANAPQEILRAMGIPFVVNQWWASIVAAKQQSRRYVGLLKERDFPPNVEAYSSQGLAAAFDADPEQAPWGGLPDPDFLYAVASSDPTVKIFDQWAAATGADCFIYERTVDPRWSLSERWWEDLPARWDQALEPERIDLMTEELATVIASLEARTGRAFSSTQFEHVMDLVNEQEEFYRRTRDLIAETVPAPIGIIDSMPATMVPQWHRGTEWARDSARAFYQEVKHRVQSGLAAVPGERVRLMWVGRGLWSDMGFYQKWEESHGAVFVWSMYLALAADGYIRSVGGGRDPMRALAARFLTMGDELRMPTWAGPWHVNEARTHSVDGAVALRDADPFVVRALREAGVPVLELGVDNFSRDPADAEVVDTAITRFIEGPASGRANQRAGVAHAPA